MLVYKCNYLTGADSLLFFTFATSFPHFEYAKHIQEIYTLYSRSEHVLLVKLKGHDNSEKIFRFSEQKEREGVGRRGRRKQRNKI